MKKWKNTTNIAEKKNIKGIIFKSCRKNETKNTISLRRINGLNWDFYEKLYVNEFMFFILVGILRGM